MEVVFYNKLSWFVSELLEIKISQTWVSVDSQDSTIICRDEIYKPFPLQEFVP